MNIDLRYDFTPLLPVTMRDIFYNQPVRRRLFHSRSVLIFAADMKFRVYIVWRRTQ